MAFLWKSALFAPVSRQGPVSGEPGRLRIDDGAVTDMLDRLRVLARIAFFPAAVLTVLFLSAGFAPAGAAMATTDDILRRAATEPGHVLLMRHATAPGTGDPANFVLDDCNTQRNLSAAGRAQAVRIGERLRAVGADDLRVFSSRWCRALETARLLGFGPVAPLPALDSFFGRPDVRGARVAALRTWLAEDGLARPVVLVTHQVLVTALTGIYPASGEIVILRRGADGDFTVVASVETE